MAYRHDIFISYKRSKETNVWIKEHFEPLLEHVVELELGYTPSIYRDDRLHDGGTWPLELGMALGCSKVLIPLWTKTYFHSEWCVLELSSMMERELEMNCRTPSNQFGLIIPMVLHNYETVQPDLAHVQYREIRRCFNVRMQRYSERAEQLADALSGAAPGIACAINNAPTWQGQWPEETANQFFRTLWRRESPQQTMVPGFSS
jgi:hypothetical protein